MADILIQFHALPEEVFSFARHCMEDLHLYAVVMKYFPFENVEVSAQDILHFSKTTSPFRELAFTIKKPILSSKDEFTKNNPSRLQIGLPILNPEGLRQVALSARTDNSDELLIWRKIANRLKKITNVGVVAMNPESGATCPAPTFRYTSGAKSLASDGVPMLPVAGRNLIKFVS
jgi:hypothetical protein